MYRLRVLIFQRNEELVKRFYPIHSIIQQKYLWKVLYFWFEIRIKCISILFTHIIFIFFNLIWLVFYTNILNHSENIQTLKPNVNLISVALFGDDLFNF